MKNKRNMLVVLAAVYCCCLILSNILAAKQWGFLGFTFTAGVLVFPVVYIINDMVTEVYGLKVARMVIVLAFLTNLFASLVLMLAIWLPAAPYYAGQEGFAATLGTMPRMLLASALSYLAGSFLNASIMAKMKQRDNARLMRRCVVSTVLGEAVDMTIFGLIAFAFSIPWDALALLIVTQAFFKIAYEVVIYPVTRKCIMWGRALD
jgi:uncharacterized integral membrane protein (TIGR00697 family)